MITIKLCEHLRAIYPFDIKVSASTLREALTSLTLIDVFNPEKTDKRYVCKVRDFEQHNSLDSKLDCDVIHLECLDVVKSEDIQGSGNNPYVRILIGAILIVISLFLLGGPTTPWGLATFSAGVSLVLGGLIQILNPIESERDSEKNKSLTAYQNTVASGTPIPIILGMHKHGGHIFSLNTLTTEAKQLNLSQIVDKVPKFGGSWVTISNYLNTKDGDSLPPVRTPPHLR